MGKILTAFSFALLVSVVYLGVFFYAHEQGHAAVCTELGGNASFMFANFGGLPTPTAMCAGLDEENMQLLKEHAIKYEPSDYPRVSFVIPVFIISFITGLYLIGWKHE